MLRVDVYLICKVDERSMDGYSMSSMAGATPGDGVSEMRR
jgi:hypothetical protein